MGRSMESLYQMTRWTLSSGTGGVRSQGSSAVNPATASAATTSTATVKSSLDTVILAVKYSVTQE